ncbi:alpha-glucuronidase [Kribbella sp. NPDC026611]|uniref:alpha-glucuronidase n=1 Tax=Kribbella sp. NPDC026611 TaxID=3154911 RepID=UPI0034005443
MSVDPAWLGTQRLPEVTVHASGVLAQTVRAELRQIRRSRTDTEVALCLLNRVHETPLPAEVQAAVPSDVLGAEGFVVVRRGDQVVVAAEAGHGLLYGFFYLLRYFEWMAGDFTVVERPATAVRMLDHWDELSGSVTRGYSGGSIFFRAGRVVEDLTRVRSYARLLASVGINAVALTSGPLPDMARLAAVFREYGIAVSLAVEADDQAAEWWSAAIARMYDAIPDLGGLVVDGVSFEVANLVARLLAAYGGTLFYRCSGVSGLDWRDRRADRARAAYDRFVPLDGRFEKNVVLQVKHGPTDFQVREPVSPLLGELQETRAGLELQVTQEYSGQQRDLCYLAPWWREVLQTELAGQTVAQRIDVVVGVSNVGDDGNWTGHKLAQSNLYAFGRLAWDPAADAVSLLHEWAAATFGMDERTRAELVGIMAGSWRTYERYTAPLGVGFMVAPGTHYGPNVNGYEYSGLGVQHFADRHGVGVDRTVASGSGFTAQYPEPLASIYEDVRTCPDELLLFFHHVAYDHVLQSGVSVVQHIYDSRFQGYAEVEAMVAGWNTIADRFEPAVRENVTTRFEAQLANAREWRDQVNTFFYRLSGVADTHGRRVHR